MPASATLTTYYTFVARQKARATQVNANFMNHRGHVIPINTDTASSSDNTHDLGALDHRFRAAYLGSAPYVNSIQTNRFEIMDIYDGSSPTFLVDPLGDLERISFPGSIDSDVRFQFVVPPTYKPGQRMSLALKGYSDTSASCVFYSTSRLYRMSLTSITGSSTPAAVLTGTATITPGAAGLIQENTSLKLTDASGLINGITVTVGDLISVGLKRAAATDAVDTSTGQFFLLGVFANMND